MTAAVSGWRVSNASAGIFTELLLSYWSGQSRFRSTPRALLRARAAKPSGLSVGAKNRRAFRARYAAVSKKRSSPGSARVMLWGTRASSAGAAERHTSSARRRMSSRPTGSSPCMFPRNANEGLGCVLPGSMDTSSARISSPFTLVPMLVTEDMPAHGPRAARRSRTPDRRWSDTATRTGERRVAGSTRERGERERDARERRRGDTPREHRASHATCDAARCPAGVAALPVPIRARRATRLLRSRVKSELARLLWNPGRFARRLERVS